MTLQEHIEEIRNGLETDRFPNETAVSQDIILRLLHALEWPRYDSQVVALEYAVEARRVNFELCPSPSKPIVFIKVKQVGDIHGPDGQLTEEQPFEDAAHKGVPIAVLTDGQKWHFFHLSGQRKYKQRKVYELDLMEDEESAERLNRYLNYKSVSTGEATKAIEEDYEQQEKIEARLPQAWKNLVQAKNQSLLHAMVKETVNLIIQSYQHVHNIHKLSTCTARLAITQTKTVYLK